MPLSVYEKVKNDIPDGVGVYAAVDFPKFEKEVVKKGLIEREETVAVWSDGFKDLRCVKNSRRRDLRADKEVVLSSMLRCMQRDTFRGNKFSYNFEEI